MATTKSPTPADQPAEETVETTQETTQETVQEFTEQPVQLRERERLQRTEQTTGTGGADDQGESSR
jgi:hypothetical protein